MKKVLMALTVLVASIAFVNVDAMSKDELKAKLTQTYNINGAEFKLTSAQAVQVERYLDNFEVSEEDATYISNKVDEAVELVKASGATSIESIPKNTKSQLSKLVSDVDKETSVKATVKNGTVIIYNPNTGAEFTRITDPVKQTGAVNYVLIASGLITLFGVSALVIKRVKSENL